MRPPSRRVSATAANFCTRSITPSRSVLPKSVWRAWGLILARFERNVSVLKASPMAFCCPGVARPKRCNNAALTSRRSCIGKALITRLAMVSPSEVPATAAANTFSGASLETIPDSSSRRPNWVLVYWLAHCQTDSASGPAFLAATPMSSDRAPYSAAHLLRGTSDTSVVSASSLPTSVLSFLTASKGKPTAWAATSSAAPAAPLAASSRSASKARSIPLILAFLNIADRFTAPSMSAFRVASARRVLSTGTMESAGMCLSRLRYRRCCTTFIPCLNPWTPRVMTSPAFTAFAPGASSSASCCTAFAMSSACLLANSPMTPAPPGTLASSDSVARATRPPVACPSVGDVPAALNVSTESATACRPASPPRSTLRTAAPAAAGSTEGARAPATPAATWAPVPPPFSRTTPDAPAPAPALAT